MNQPSGRWLISEPKEGLCENDCCSYLEPRTPFEFLSVVFNSGPTGRRSGGPGHALCVGSLICDLRVMTGPVAWSAVALS